MFSSLQRFQQWLDIDGPSRHNTMFLIGGIATVGLLAFVKATTEPPIRPRTVILHERKRLTSLSARMRLDNTLHNVNSHQFAITAQPITNAQYHRFTQAAEYRTVRERQGLKKTWISPYDESNKSPAWQSAPEDPVLWLARCDAEAFCLWIARQAGVESPYDRKSTGPLYEEKGFRLPTTEELEAADVASNNWLWTCEDLSHVTSSRKNAADYLTAWRDKEAIRHRTESNVTAPDHEPTGFYVTWTISP